MLIRLDSTQPAPARVPDTFHVWQVNISGSMYHELPGLRQDLKNRLATHLRPGDMLTVIYYSSRGECGYVLDRFKVSDPSTLTLAQAALDRFLVPMNMTGFVDPLNLALKSIQAMETDMLVSMLFLSDGYENQNSKDAVLEATRRLSTVIGTGAVVEYGDYANHGLLSEMAEILRVPLVYSENVPSFDGLMQSYLSGSSDSLFDVMGVAPDTKVFFTVEPNTGLVSAYRPVNEAVRFRHVLGTPVYMIHDRAPESIMLHDKEDLVYAVIACVTLGEAKHAWEMLSLLGDVDLIDRYAAAIGKQKRNQYLAHLYKVVRGEEPFYAKGNNPNYLPPDDAFCMLDLLSFMEEHDTQLLTRHPNFNYRRGGKPRVSTSELVFVEDRDQTVTFKSIVRSSSRANLSVRGMYKGYVDVSKEPGNTFGLGIIKTHIYRTYTLVRDGVLVMDEVPVELSQPAHVALSKVLPLGQFIEGSVQMLPLRALPIVNREFIQHLNGKDFCGLQLQLETLKAVQKVFRYYETLLDAKPVSPGWAETYGADATAWLKSIGLTESNGFSPKTVGSTEEASDSYIATTLDVKLKGLSSLPAVEVTINKQLEGKKLTVADELILAGIRLYQQVVGKAVDPLKAVHQATIDVVAQKREIERRVAELVFVKLLSNTLFSHLNDDGTCTLHLPAEASVIIREQNRIPAQVPNHVYLSTPLPPLEVQATVVEQELVVEI